MVTDQTLLPEAGFLDKEIDPSLDLFAEIEKLKHRVILFVPAVMPWL